jgi:NADPH-dependent 2,4-dienoyl-CoA reductase/sulfur reductase-like enzyme
MQLFGHLKLVLEIPTETVNFDRGASNSSGFGQGDPSRDEINMRHVIIGNGITGVSAAQAIREQDDEAQITLIGDETRYFYARTALMWIYMRQMTSRNTEPFEPWYWREQRIELLQDQVTAIDPAAHTLTLSAGGTLDYDRLLLAIGAEPNMFGWSGQELDGVCNMTSMHDLQKLEAVRPRLRRAVVVGGGLIGIELVEMMLHDRVPVTYLLREPWYWDLVLSKEEATVVHERLRASGAELILEDEIGEIGDDGQGRVKQVTTKQGKALPCELLGIAVGVHPRKELAEAAGISCGRGVLVDRRMRTDAPDVFAAGDCAEVQWDDGSSRIEQLWYTGIKQGRAAGESMLGAAAPYDTGVPYSSAQFLFIDYANVGWMNLARFRPPPEIIGEDYAFPEGRELGLEEFFHRAAGTNDSIRVSHRPDTKQVLGFSMLSSRWDSRVLMTWIRQRKRLDWVLRHLREAAYNEEFWPKGRFAALADRQEARHA